MSEKTKIAWCDSTFNPWIGCSKIGPGCDNCYAEVQDSRMRWEGKKHWGAGVPRYRTSTSYWKQPLRWNNLQWMKLAAWNAGVEMVGGNESVLLARGFTKPAPWRVFCASLADFADNEVPQAWRDDLWDLIGRTPYLSWLLVTKRIGNVARMVPRAWLENGFPQNVRVIPTICTQEEAERDVPKVLELRCKNGISYEPALGPVDWTRIEILRETVRGGSTQPVHMNALADYRGHRSLEWIIIGGESAQGGKPARSFDVGWARSTVAQCKAANVPVFVKQLGPRPTMGDETSSLGRALREGGYELKDRAGADPSEWPEDLRVREYPE